MNGDVQNNNNIHQNVTFNGNNNNNNDTSTAKQILNLDKYQAGQQNSELLRRPGEMTCDSSVNSDDGSDSEEIDLTTTSGCIDYSNSGANLNKL